MRTRRVRPRLRALRARSSLPAARVAGGSQTPHAASSAILRAERRQEMRGHMLSFRGDNTDELRDQARGDKQRLIRQIDEVPRVPFRVICKQQYSRKPNLRHDALRAASPRSPSVSLRQAGVCVPRLHTLAASGSTQYAHVKHVSLGIPFRLKGTGRAPQPRVSCHAAASFELSTQATNAFHPVRRTQHLLSPFRASAHGRSPHQHPRH